MAERGAYTYDYPRPMVTVDAVVFAVFDGALHVLMIQRKHDPFAGAFALPGGFMEMDEPLLTAAARELAEETGLRNVPLHQFHCFGEDVHRDPRGRCVTAAYLALEDASRHAPRAADDAADAAWLPVDDLPELAFDHNDIVRRGRERLREISYLGAIGLRALGETFSLDEALTLYRAVRGEPVTPEALQSELESRCVASKGEHGAEYAFRRTIRPAV
jgi:8-oxo-dGTP diphosphatase